MYLLSAECNRRQPWGSEERKNYPISNISKVYFFIGLSFVSFFPLFLLNQRFEGFSPPSSEFQRINEGNKQDTPFFSPQQRSKIFPSLEEALI